MNFSERAFEACKAKAEELGRKLTAEEWKDVVQFTFDAAQAEWMEQASTPKIDKRTQAELFNSIAMACGMNPLECTSAMKKTIAVALADIRSVTPGLTPDEIAKRARTYKTKHRDWPLTVMSLAKYWGDLGTNDMGRTYAAQVGLEPPNWKETLPKLMPDAEPATISYMINQLGWNRISASMQETIRKRCAV
jgi:hypothetical protein